MWWLWQRRWSSMEWDEMRDEVDSGCRAVFFPRIDLPCDAGCCRLVIDRQDWLSRCSDRSTGSCSSPCRSRDTHLPVTHPLSGRVTTSPELQRTTGCGKNDVIKPMPHGDTTGAACAKCGCISGLEISTLFACILSTRVSIPLTTGRFTPLSSRASNYVTEILL